MESEPDCNHDYIEAREGGSGGQLLGRFCGTQLPTNITAFHHLYVKFRSNEEVPGLGFMAMYNSREHN